MTATAIRPGVGRDSIADADRQSRRTFELLAELGVLALALGTTASLNRLFVGWTFLGSLALPVTACWVTTLAMRRWRLPVLAALAASILIGIVFLTLQFAPGTSLVGLPTGRTLDSVRLLLDESFGGFNRLIAPVDVSDGFLVVIAAVLWLFGFFADTAAFRYSSPIQAAIPYSATFVAIGILAREPGRIGAALWFLAGVACYAVTQRALRATEQRWIRSETGRGATAVGVAAGGLAAAALVVGMVASPLLPDSTDPVVDLRALGRAGDARTVTSPFVGVRSLLGQQSDTVLFEVQAPQAAYWRLTSLERFDEARGIWVSEGTYRKSSGDLDATTVDGSSAEPLPQKFVIDNLDTIWLPAAFTPTRIDESTVEISFDDDSSSLIARGTNLQPDTTYQVESEPVVIDPATLSGSAEGNNLEPVYKEKADLLPENEQELRQVVAAAASPYDKMLALQNWFRGEFVYDQTVNYSEAPDAVGAFLSERRGFCQQFASTFALMARSLGFGARVGVGFTPGDLVDLKQQGSLVGSDEGGDQPVPGYLVRGRHAHTWPEVYFDDVGWVPFEPTPGRGNAQAVQYTGVAAAQAAPPEDQAATTTPPTTAAPFAPEQEQPGLESGAVNTTGADPEPAEAEGRLSAASWLVWAAAVALTLLAIAVVARTAVHIRRRSSARHDPHGGRVASAWEESISWLALLGVRPRLSETPAEFSRRARPIIGIATFDSLAVAETIRRFGPSDPTDEQCRDAEQIADEVRDRVRGATSRTQQLRRLVR